MEWSPRELQTKSNSSRSISSIHSVELWPNKMLDLSLETESKEEHEALLGDKHMVISMGKSYLNAENETQNNFFVLFFLCLPLHLPQSTHTKC